MQRQSYISLLLTIACVVLIAPGRALTNDSQTILASYASDLQGAVIEEKPRLISHDVHSYDPSDKFIIPMRHDVQLSLKSKAELINSSILSNWITPTYAYFSDPEPSIEFSATTVKFKAIEGGINPEDQKIYIWNGSSQALNWEINENCSWFEVNPTSGISSGDPNEVTLSVDITSLTQGIYEGELVISDPYAINSPQSIDITLNVACNQINYVCFLADLSCDFFIGVEDLELIAKYWLSPGASSNGTDLNDDGIVNLLDFTWLANFWLVDCTTTCPPAIEKVESNYLGDTDNIYERNSVITILVNEQHTGLEIISGTVKITSSSQNYDSGDITLTQSEENINLYQCVWDTTGL